jgi:hypothetical protein
MPTTTQRETKAHNQLKKRCYRLEKTPARHWTRAEYGVGYQVLDDRNVVIQGCYQREFEMTLEEVEEYVEHLARCDLQFDILRARGTFTAAGGRPENFCRFIDELFGVEAA